MEIQANGVRIHYQMEGVGPPLLLVHGNSDSLAFFDVLTPALAAGHTVYRLDSRRHGKSEMTGEISYDLLAADTAAFVRALGLDRPVLIGASDGGIVGLLLSIRQPGLLGGHIACGANTHPMGLKRWFYAASWLASRTQRGSNLRMMVEQPDITAGQLAGISTPTLVMAGSRDLIRDAHTRELAAAIPGAELCILKGETHTSYLQKPAVFLQHAAGFLKAHSG